MNQRDDDFRWKYNEGPQLDDIKQYIQSTYGEHYAHDVDDKGMQLFDLWDGMDILIPTCQATALKYITRFGRKGGHNKKDIYKAIHYCLLLLNATRKEEEEQMKPSPNLIDLPQSSIDRDMGPTILSEKDYHDVAMQNGPQSFGANYSG